jgi:hypothetical protein
VIFGHIALGGWQSCLHGAAHRRAAALVDPEISQLDRYLGLGARDCKLRADLDPRAPILRALGFQRAVAPDEGMRGPGRRRRCADKLI